VASAANMNPNNKQSVAEMIAGYDPETAETAYQHS